MAIVNLVQKRMRMPLWDIVRYQIMHYCYLNKLCVIDSDLDLLTLLACVGESELSKFCILASDKGIFTDPQTVRNRLAKAEKRSLVIKQGRNRKKIYINPEFKVQATGNVMLDLKIASLDTKEN